MMIINQKTIGYFPCPSHLIATSVRVLYDNGIRAKNYNAQTLVNESLEKFIDSKGDKNKNTEILA